MDEQSDVKAAVNVPEKPGAPAAPTSLAPPTTKMIQAMLAAANMDPEANPHPERLDLQRKPNRHIAFGTGIHFCLGHQLARIEGRCALKSLFRRWPTLALAVDPSEITWRQRPGLKAIDRLPVVAARPAPDLAGTKPR